LPECFTLDDVVKYYECGKTSASVIAGRLVQDGAVVKLQRGRFKKISASL
jgi:predicted transcriptional regulator of viral defense system